TSGVPGCLAPATIGFVSRNTAFPTRRTRCVGGHGIATSDPAPRGNARHFILRTLPSVPRPLGRARVVPSRALMVSCRALMVRYGRTFDPARSAYDRGDRAVAGVPAGPGGRNHPGAGVAGGPRG